MLLMVMSPEGWLIIMAVGVLFIVGVVFDFAIRYKRNIKPPDDPENKIYK